jgi:hypothetical protein
MSKHIIFFVHGIGDDAKGWSKDLRAEFKALFDSYPLPPGGQPFSVQFQTEEIFYNDFFDGWRTSCPRLPVWEECTDQGLVARRGRAVELTERGRSFLEGRP